tara:strand:- start:2 stop:322 length:321 start_codon:yes stop_codon:yes gene_type:complete
VKTKNKIKDLEIGEIKEIKITFEGIDDILTIRKNDKSREIGKKTKKCKDPCKVCKEDLYYDENYSQRVALQEEDVVLGWLCPYCFSEFDLNDNLIKLMTKKPQGEA